MQLRKLRHRCPIYWVRFSKTLYVKLTDYILIAMVLLCCVYCALGFFDLRQKTIFINYRHDNSLKKLNNTLRRSAWWRKHTMTAVDSMHFLQQLNGIARHAGVNITSVLLLKSSKQQGLKLHEYALDAYGGWQNNLSFLNHLDLLPGVQSWSDCKIEAVSNSKLHMQLQLYNWQGGSL